ncbi:hypothetical protein AB4298_09780 [Shewanella sp. 10N.261.52.F9]|uniref:hypothetical protein n=1 Tax=Shewanella TaxID=22 RepID=UPI00200C1B24|nr:hypothetical protein [Shewanella marinintestina]MCL1145700.1 hypothetical protein [Shewanella marinintestina]
MKKTSSSCITRAKIESSSGGNTQEIKHAWHFVLTLLTLGLWGIVWWWLILRAEGKAIFSGFDDAYWSYLMETEQPPAALYKMHFSKNNKKSKFDA